MPRSQIWSQRTEFPMPQPRRNRLLKIALLLALPVAAGLTTSSGRNALWSAWSSVRGRATVADRVAALDGAVRDDVRAWCAQADVHYPPREVALVAFKEERELHVFGRTDAAWKHLVTLPILGASGTLGPKLADGDRQVPEGVYAIESLHPNSRFHLALRVGYPNAFDRDRAKSDQRTALGGDIMIHGGSASIGCLAMGDDAIERVFLLCADVGVDAIQLVIAPCDFRRTDPPAHPGAPPWIDELYTLLRFEVAKFPAPRYDLGTPASAAGFFFPRRARRMMINGMNVAPTLMKTAVGTPLVRALNGASKPAFGFRYASFVP